MNPIWIVTLALCLSSCTSFNLLEEDNLIPSDGFHDLLGLTPFWLSGHDTDSMRRTLGEKRNNLPNTWSAIASQKSGTKMYKMHGHCNIEGSFTAEKAVLDLKKDGDCTVPSLKIIFAKLFPSVDVFASTQNFILPEKFDFKQLEIFGSNVKVKSKSRDTWGIAERRILLNDAELTLGFTAGEPVTSMKSWTLSAVGTIGVSTHSMTMTISKLKGETNMPFTWDISSVLMGDLMGLFGITMDYFKFNDIGFDSTKLEGITFNGASMNGVLKPDETYQLVAKASVSFSQAIRSGDVYLILTRNSGANTIAAVVIDIRDIFNIGEALEVFIRQHDFISDFGMLGRIERDCIIMLAKEDIVMVDNEDIKKIISPFITEFDTKQIPKGVNVRVKVPMKENMKKKCSASANIAGEVPEILPITIKISAGGLAFDYPEKFKADLPSMLKCLDPQIAAELPSQLFPKPDGPINIKELTIGGKDYAKITVVLNGPFEFLGGKISIADLEVSVEWNRGEDIKFSGVTTITVGPLAVGLTIEKEGDSYTFAAYVESFKLNQLESMIGRSTFTGFMSLLGSLDGFGIKDFKLTKNFGKGSDSALRVSGVPILWGWDKISLEGLIWYPKDRTGGQPEKAVAVGMVVEGIRLDQLMEKIVGKNLFTTAWFSEMVAIVIVSNAKAKVESSEDNDGEEKDANDIGNKDKELKPEDDEESTARTRSLYDGFGTNEFTVARYARDLKSKALRHIRGYNNASKRGKAPLNKFAMPAKHQRPALRPIKTLKYAKVRKHLTATRRQEKKEEAKGADDDEEEEEEVKFKIPYLSSQDIEPGLTFIGIFNIPQDNGCKGDALCLWLGETVGRDATIEISGRIGKGEFEFGAKFAGSIPLIEGKLNMQSIEMKVTLSGKESSVKLECTMYWADKEILGSSQLQLTGAIEVSLTGKLNLEFNMIDIWRKPFGFEYLAFGNLHLAIGISVGVPLPSFEFGGEIWIGKIKEGTNDHAIKIAGYFGIDPNRPTDNYVYASVNEFTLKKVFEAFELGSPNVPSFVANTGFPEGITVAYSLAGKTIDALDIEIEAGLYLKGTINFLGYNVSAEIIANPPEKFLVDVQMSPIDWAGGLIALRRSEADRKNGPKAFIYLKPDSVTVQIEGYISLLGMARYVLIDVSDTAFKFNMTTDLWGMIRSELFVEAAYGSLSALSFEFKASVSVDFHFKELFAAVKGYLKKAADTAKAKIENAQRKVAEARQALENAQRKMDGWKRSIDDYQERLRRRSAEIEEAKKTFERNCKAECGKVCVPFLDWNPKCFKVWWWWVGCPTWNNCKWKVDNIICIAGCEIKKQAKKFVAWAEQTGIKILTGLSDMAKGLIDVGKGFVTMAEKLVDFANDFLNFVKKVVAVGSQILQDVTDWLGDNLFKITILELSGKLDNDFNACVGLNIDCVLIGLRIKYKGTICVNVNFWKSVAASASEKKYAGLQKMNNDLPQIDGKEEELNEDKIDLDNEEKRIESDVKKDTTRRRKRDYVPTAEEMYYHKLANEKLPPVVTRSAETIAAFKNDAPWVLIQDFDARNFDHTPHQDENIPAEKRTLDEDWKEHASSPCLQMKKVLSKYSMITDGLSAMSSSVRNARENYQATKRSMQQGVDDLESKVRLTEMRHNMTHEERGDLYHWYNEAKEGLAKWDKKTSQLLEDQYMMALPTFRSQINHILSKEKNTDLSGYMHELHSISEAAYKRSEIPSENMNEAMHDLKAIKKGIISLVHEDERNPLVFSSRLRSIQSNIRGLRRSMSRCE